MYILCVIIGEALRAACDSSGGSDNRKVDGDWPLQASQRRRQEATLEPIQVRLSQKYYVHE